MRFEQVQRFEGGWRWFWAAIFLAPGAVVLVVLLVTAAATGVDLTLPLLILGALELAGVAALILLLRTPIIVQVTDDAVRIRVAPFFGEDIPAAEIASVEEVTSGMWRRYGAGAGRRYGERRARYTVGDDAGVVIQCSNGWRIVIGSKRSAELAAAIRGLMRPSRWD